MAQFAPRRAIPRVDDLANASSAPAHFGSPAHRWRAVNAGRRASLCHRPVQNDRQPRETTRWGRNRARNSASDDAAMPVTGLRRPILLLIAPYADRVVSRPRHGRPAALAKPTRRAHARAIARRDGQERINMRQRAPPNSGDSPGARRQQPNSRLRRPIRRISASSCSSLGIAEARSACGVTRQCRERPQRQRQRKPQRQPQKADCHRLVTAQDGGHRDRLSGAHPRRTEQKRRHSHRCRWPHADGHRLRR